MAFCKFCGCSVPDAADFCPECGKKLKKALKIQKNADRWGLPLC